MKLDRNIAGNRGRGKYAVVKMRVVKQLIEESSTVRQAVQDALRTLTSLGALDYGEYGTIEEFFLVRLKDAFACDALQAYSEAARKFDREYADEVLELATRSGPHSSFCKMPD